MSDANADTGSNKLAPEGLPPAARQTLTACSQTPPSVVIIADLPLVSLCPHQT